MTIIRPDLDQVISLYGSSLPDYDYVLKKLIQITGEGSFLQGVMNYWLNLNVITILNYTKMKLEFKLHYLECFVKVMKKPLIYGLN